MAGGANPSDVVGMIATGVISSVMAGLTMADLTYPVIVAITILVAISKRIHCLCRIVFARLPSYLKGHITGQCAVNGVWSVNFC